MRFLGIEIGAGAGVTNTPTSFTKPDAPVAAAGASILATSFLASWSEAPGWLSYKLDVATDVNFTTFVTGFENLTVTAISKSVTGLTTGTQYWYRVRAINAFGTSVNSNVITVTTA